MAKTPKRVKTAEEKIVLAARKAFEDDPTYESYENYYDLQEGFFRTAEGIVVLRENAMTLLAERQYDYAARLLKNAIQLEIIVKLGRYSRKTESELLAV